MPAPWRRVDGAPEVVVSEMFQSQARCQPRGDMAARNARSAILISFNLKRDASPVATRRARLYTLAALTVSISSEMQAPWRRLMPDDELCERCVSISSEMP